MDASKSLRFQGFSWTKSSADVQRNPPKATPNKYIFESIQYGGLALRIDAGRGRARRQKCGPPTRSILGVGKHMALSNLRIQHAKATGKPYTLGDFDGLSLFVSAKGSKAWHFRYYWVGKQIRISLGTYSTGHWPFRRCLPKVASTACWAIRRGNASSCRKKSSLPLATAT
ncbi:Arm DNA-binding domain-containing protein [Paraburkholderia sp. SIMBA_027]